MPHHNAVIAHRQSMSYFISPACCVRRPANTLITLAGDAHVICRNDAQASVNVDLVICIVRDGDQFRVLLDLSTLQPIVAAIPYHARLEHRRLSRPIDTTRLTTLTCCFQCRGLVAIQHHAWSPASAVDEQTRRNPFTIWSPANKIQHHAHNASPPEHVSSMPTSLGIPYYSRCNGYAHVEMELHRQ
jgi:hypothetical protein